MIRITKKFENEEQKTQEKQVLRAKTRVKQPKKPKKNKESNRKGRIWPEHETHVYITLMTKKPRSFEKDLSKFLKNYNEKFDLEMNTSEK